MKCGREWTYHISPLVPFIASCMQGCGWFEHWPTFDCVMGPIDVFHANHLFEANHITSFQPMQMVLKACNNTRCTLQKVRELGRECGDEGREGIREGGEKGGRGEGREGRREGGEKGGRGEGREGRREGGEKGGRGEGREGRREGGEKGREGRKGGRGEREGGGGREERKSERGGKERGEEGKERGREWMKRDFDDITGRKVKAKTKDK